MSNDAKTPPSGPAKPAKPGTEAAKPPEPRSIALDERKFKYAELAAIREALVPAELIAALRDGRGTVRANAALGLASLGQAPADLATLLRDSEASVATAAAEAIGRLGIAVKPLIAQIAPALESTHTDVTESVVGTLCELIGLADEELTLALDLPFDLAMKGVVAAAGRAEKKGIAFLVKATAHERSRIRINAIGGLGRFGKIDPSVAMGCLTPLEATDPVPDVRTAAKQAMLAVVAREKVEIVDGLPKNIPDFEDRKLSASECAEYADVIDVDQMIYALRDGRTHVKINGARCLGVKGEAGGRAASEIGLLLRDSAEQVRREAAKALGKLGKGGLGAAAELVGALGDADSETAETAAETLARLGAQAAEALVKGLETGSEEGGRRVGELIARLPNAATLLTEAFKSPAVNVQVNAALGLGVLGKDKVGAGLAALHGARTGGDARTREAVRRALDLIEPRGDTGPKAVTIEGFEERFLGAADLEKAKAAVTAAGTADLTAYLTDGRDVVRANAATALGTFGAAAAGSARSLGVLLRDDSARARLAAAQALDKLGDAAVIEVADDLVGGLGDADDKVAETCAGVIKARKARMIAALVRGLESDRPNHGRRICELINVFEDAPEILCDAFASPAVNVQINAALGLGMLGKARVGKGRAALEGARTGGWEQTRNAVRKALEVLDGPKKTGPSVPEIDGFEAKLLGPDAFKDATKLVIEDLVSYLTDGRAIVRANAATALGSLGAAAKDTARAIGVLLRDDDMAVRARAAAAVDKLGDEAVREIAPFLVGALRGDADVAKAVAPVLAARKARMLGALIKGLETDDETHARRILELVNALPDAGEILIDAFASPAENVQVNAAMGLGMLGEAKAGSAGRKALEGARTGGFARTREAVFKALAMLKG
ncbi:MAG: HEAT repeat domain-containing protein [Myxococcales bacterium]|nr:HEAT repeat domain-containing protein [Myxococcales bacterium]